MNLERDELRMRRGEFDPKIIAVIVLAGLLLIVLLIASRRIFGTLG